MLRHKSLHPLSHQHHNGLSLCVLVLRSLDEDAGEENRKRLAGRVADRFQAELENHFELEERELFPAIEGELGPSEAVARLVLEHAQMRAMRNAMEANPEERLLRDFCLLLRTHIRFEEDELFERVQDKLAAATMERLGNEFEKRAVRVCLEP